MRRALVVSASLLVLTAASTALADYNESVSGDLSNNNLAPTPVTLNAGNNLITGTTGVTAGVVDRDYLTVVIPANAKLTSIMVNQYTGSASGVSFIGVETGPTFTDPTTTTPAQTLGYMHFGVSTIGTNILPGMGTGAGSMGFVPPLGPGQYTFWIQEANLPPLNYQFNFQVTAQVPALPPAFAWVLGAMALVGGAAISRRKRTSTASLATG